MSLIEILFKKSIKELEFKDIQEYFTNDKHEANNIEFKSYDPKRNGGFKEAYDAVVKAICAFLNTDGGIVIWGAPKGIKRGDDIEKSYFLPLKPVPHKIEDDQFIDKISGRISPLCKGVSFQRINGGKYDQDKDTFIYVIEVKQSEFPPHQFDGTYYMRSEASTRIQPHQFVEAQMKRISIPNVQTHVVFGKPLPVSSNILIPFSILISNESYYIHEKNLKFRILTKGCETIQDINSRRFEFKPSSDTLIDAADILLCGMPVYERFCLATNEKFLNAQDHSIYVAIFIFGEFTPVRICEYNFKVTYAYGDPSSAKLIEAGKTENEFLFQQKEDKQKAGFLKNQQFVDTDSMEKWTAILVESIFYRSLRGQI